MSRVVDCLVFTGFWVWIPSATKEKRKKSEVEGDVGLFGLRFSRSGSGPGICMSNQMECSVIQPVGPELGPERSHPTLRGLLPREFNLIHFRIVYGLSSSLSYQPTEALFGGTSFGCYILFQSYLRVCQETPLRQISLALQIGCRPFRASAFWPLLTSTTVITRLASELRLHCFPIL